MTEHTSLPDLENFFANYGAALATGDLKAISECYGIPSLVLSDAGSVPVSSREEIEAAFDGAAEGHREQGLVSARPDIVSTEALTEKLVSVSVKWDYLDEAGNSVQRDGYRYILKLDEEGPRIYVVVAIPVQ